MKDFTSKFEKSMITVDIVVFAVEEKTLKALLIKRKYDPFRGFWALPGGFVRKSEELMSSARRELKEETGISGIYLEQLYTVGDVGRDPRGRVVTVAYFALAPKYSVKLRASYDALEAKMFPIDALPKLAFDHKKILDYALVRLQNKIQYTNVAWSLLPEKFTLREIQEVYEIIWKRRIDKRNFRKKILSLGLLKSLPGIRRGLRQRPAKLYSFKTKKYVELRRFL